MNNKYIIPHNPLLVKLKILRPHHLQTDPSNLHHTHHKPLSTRRHQRKSLPQIQLCKEALAVLPDKDLLLHIYKCEVSHSCNH